MQCYRLVRNIGFQLGSELSPTAATVALLLLLYLLWFNVVLHHAETHWKLFMDKIVFKIFPVIGNWRCAGTQTKTEITDKKLRDDSSK